MTHPYQDPNRALAERVADLLARMTLEEKAGLLFHHAIGIGALAAPAGCTAEQMMSESGMTHFNLLGAGTARQMADLHNSLQARAADTRLAIPVTLSTDPRHAFTDNPGTAMMAGPFSQWPEPLGLAAVADPGLVRRYADTVRREYLAVGLRVALHPQIDLATEPRWARVSGTFGEDADLTSRLVTAYIRGLHGPGGRLGPDSVAAMVKHFPGGGAQQDGEDPHFPYGREQIYPGGRFDYHLRPFKAAVDAGATQVMPYYGMPVGTEYEEVGFGFNKGVITGLLRERLGFTGIVCTDWGLLQDGPILGEMHAARAWGVEHLTPAERVVKALNAGVDQFGGDHCPELVVDLVRAGVLAESRIDASARLLLAEKFRLGLFDQRRYVDPDHAEATVGRADFRAAGLQAQRRSLTVLKNPLRERERAPLPLSGRTRLYLEGVDTALAAGYAQVVADPADADVAVLRLTTPYEPRPGRFEGFFHAGRLDFPPDRLKEILALLDAVPTVVAIHLERPAVIPEIAERCAALVGVYGVGDQGLLDVLFGRAAPEGRLPFQLLRSMDEVRRGRPDVPQESPDPLFPFGHGLRYPDPDNSPRGIHVPYAIDPELILPAGVDIPDVSFTDYAALRATEGDFLALLPTYEPVSPVSVRDAYVPGLEGAPDVRVRVYTPTGREGGLPGLLYIHGGGFAIGSVKLSDSDALRIADQVGTVVVSVDYRLAPEHPFPAPVEDCYAALVWAAKNSAELGIDPQRLGILGESAGGGLAAATTLMARDRGGPALCFQYLGNPELDDRLDTPSMRDYRDTPGWNRPNAEISWDFYLGEGVRGGADVSYYAAPSRAEDLTGLPPAYVTACQFDPLRDEDIDYAQRLAHAGIPTELRLYPATHHGAILMAGAAVARRMVADQLEALRRGLALRGCRR